MVKNKQNIFQDIAQKLLEAVSTVAGLCLEQTTWLRRNLAVKPGPQTDITETEEGEITEDSGELFLFWMLSIKKTKYLIKKKKLWHLLEPSTAALHKSLTAVCGKFSLSHNHNIYNMYSKNENA